MLEEKVRILVVAPFEGLAEEARRVAAERFPQLAGKIRTVVADLGEAEDLYRQGGMEGVRVLVSRGGTADTLERVTHLPVVRIQASTVDVLQAVRRAGAIGHVHCVGLAGFPSMMYGVEEIEGVLPLAFSEITVRGASDATQKIEEAAKAGVELVIGDAVSVRAAQALGLPAEFIHSGKQAIFLALQEAVLLEHVIADDRARAAMMRTVVDASRDGILATDRGGRITIFSPAAADIFHCDRQMALGRLLSEVARPLADAGPAPDDTILAVHGRRYLVKTAVIDAGGRREKHVYTLSSITDVQRAERMVRRTVLAKRLVACHHIEDVLGTSPAALRMKERARRYAATDATILVTGASGTGKEMLVQSIHNLSPRREGPFVAVNCAAFPESLLESELFGYVEGAFTGARKGGRQGVFEMAHTGTIFLDEIGEMPLTLQPRLLRVLQEREIMKLGGEHMTPIDVRVIAATNEDLPALIRAGKFREDLYYRLNILRIQMPTLKERREDIPLLAEAMLRAHAREGRPAPVLLPRAKNFLMELPYPGNIRQLQNLMERVALLAESDRISREAICTALEDDFSDVKGKSEAALTPHPAGEEQLLRVLAEEGGNLARTAERLGIHRTTLYRRLKRLGREATE